MCTALKTKIRNMQYINFSKSMFVRPFIKMHKSYPKPLPVLNNVRSVHYCNVSYECNVTFITFEENLELRKQPTDLTHNRTFCLHVHFPCVPTVMFHTGFKNTGLKKSGTENPSLNEIIMSREIFFSGRGGDFFF